MALTDEQYQQILRYSDGEMDGDELKAFEIALAQNKELNDELEFYKQVRLLSHSVEKKTGDPDQWLSEEKKSLNDDVRKIITEARKQWETQHEADLKLKIEVDSLEHTNISSLVRKPKAFKMNASTWLAAAVVAGIVCLGAGFWFFTSRKDNSETVATSKTIDSVELSDKKVTGPVTDSARITDSSISIEKKPQDNLVKKIKTSKELFEESFIPDRVPANKEGPLENALNYYESKMYIEASREFETADIGPLTRGLEDVNQKLATFYIHYYKALSYLAADIKTSRAITELKTSITKSPDNTSKTKATWYLALAYLKNGNTQTAINYLEQIAHGQASNGLKQKAVSLRNMLRK